MVSDVGIPFSSGNEAFALMFPYFRFFESIIDVNRAHGLRYDMLFKVNNELKNKLES